MKEATLQVESRTGAGKGVARKLRQAGKAPGIVYGPEREPQSVAVSQAEMNRILRQYHGVNVLLNLDVDGKGVTGKKAIVRAIQRDPVRGELLHVDFHQISMTKPLHIKVPVHLHGVPDGVKNSGGILSHSVRELEVTCLPTAIPEGVDLDVSALGIHGSIHVRDITIAGATILNDPDQTVVSVVAPTVMATPTPEEAAAAPAEPELIERKKKEDAEEK